MGKAKGKYQIAKGWRLIFQNEKKGADLLPFAF
jgi:hypothetical protein